MGKLPSLRDYKIDLGEDTSEDDPEKQTAYEKILGLPPKAALDRLSAWVANHEKNGWRVNGK